MSLRDRVRFWNATAADRVGVHPADEHVPPGSEHFVRAIDVDADAATTWRWVCQISLAPYSYDLVDNLGRRSPQMLVPDADDLRLGQKFSIGPIVHLEPGHSVAAAVVGRPARVFGAVAMSWQVEPGPGATSRIVACLALGPARSPGRRSWYTLLGAGDLVMLRRQLLNLKRLAEGTPAER